MDDLQRKENIRRLWHADRNDWDVDDVKVGSHKVYWWLCEAGHPWQAPAYAIARGDGCPYCAGKLPIPGETDLASARPDLAAEWDEARTGFSPSSVTQGSTRKAWWVCTKGHSYEAAVFSRAGGSGCPYCCGRKVLRGETDLATTDPLVAAEWCSALNGGLSPQDVSRGSHKKVWWQCREGHFWQAAVYSRTRINASGCPVCSGKTVKKLPPMPLSAR